MCRIRGLVCGVCGVCGVYGVCGVCGVCELFSVILCQTVTVEATNNDIILLHTQTSRRVWHMGTAIGIKGEDSCEKRLISPLYLIVDLSRDDLRKNTNYIFQPTFFVQVYPSLLLSFLLTSPSGRGQLGRRT